ncbi:uncharacterized protein B0I36DRAFT_20983 [Microdochium trichocladiopsis]|uniref:Uncharacterized protein n=1 Tax=Microdochium trichocladiopsis TaxID=1682393 RepID=A0A9P8YJP7_9PEZI|nr:uncharacterized protein B0I36DRAFT_20983 [Microdochium trichocladiopsis]KAH7041258.1 hypothetical protein B0I36DRAFT_20983 [Microdochium trichocladiopsis]
MPSLFARRQVLAGSPPGQRAPPPFVSISKASGVHHPTTKSGGPPHPIPAHLTPGPCPERSTRRQLHRKLQSVSCRARMSRHPSLSELAASLRNTCSKVLTTARRLKANAHGYSECLPRVAALGAEMNDSRPNICACGFGQVKRARYIHSTHRPSVRTHSTWLRTLPRSAMSRTGGSDECLARRFAHDDSRGSETNAGD